MKAARLLKLFEYFNSDNTSAKSEHHRLSEIKLKRESTKKTVRFINRKMIVPILLMIQSFSFSVLKANTNLNDDGCTVDVIATASTILNPGCQEGTITLTPQTADVYAYEIRPMYDLSQIQESSSMSRTGTSVTATYHMAGDYAVYITTLSGCTGIGYVTINQPPCPTITPSISVTNATLNGATNGAVQFSFNAGNSCSGSWVYLFTSSLGGTTFGVIPDPVPSPGVISTSINELSSGTYTVGIFPGGNINYASACVANTNFTISQPACDLSITQNVIQPLSNACNSGQVNLQITGQTFNDYYVVELYKNSIAVGTYYATEIDGAGTLNISSLEAANYAIRVYNGAPLGSCYSDIIFDIIDPACNIAITGFTATNSIAQACNSGSAEATLEGTTCNGYYVAELTFNGNPYANYYPTETSGAGTITMSGLMAGNYILNVNNGNSCTQTHNFTISEPACNVAISNLSSTNLTGFGCNDGTLDVAFTGTTCNSYYIVNLTKDGSLYGSYYPAETSGAVNLTLLPAGNYTFELTNGNAICSATQNFIITEPACNTVIANFATNNPTANIGNNGGVSFDAQGSSCGGNYYYEIYNGGSLQTSGYIAVTGSSSPALISGLVAGSYELKLYSAYGSTCIANQTFTLTDAACNVAISGLTANNISSGCGNGTINFNASGNTAYGYYTLLIEKDGSYYNSISITPTGATTAYSVTDLPVGSYSLTLSDGAPTPCTSQQSIAITEATCDVLIINPVLTEISITGNNDGAVSGSILGTTCSGNYLVKLFNSGNFVSSQVVSTTNPNFEFHNLFAGLYEIQAFSGENVGNTCFNEYGFLLIDPCPVGNISVALDTSLAPCDVVVMTATISGATDPSTVYYVQYRVDGGPWQYLASYYGYPGAQTVSYNIAYDGYYELRSGPLVVLSTCPASTGFNVHKNYCDAYTSSTSTTPASNNCSNGKFTLNIVDPQRCSYQTYVGYIFSAGDTVANLSVTNISGNNVTAVANLPAGNYAYTFYTIGTYLTGLTQPKCPISGSFTIDDAGCNITYTNEVIINNCNGTEYNAQINGITCNGQFQVKLYKDGNLLESGNVYEYSTVGNIGYSSLSPGNYNIKVYPDHLNPTACVGERNFTVNPISCDLAISNVVILNAASDLSTYGSVNFDVSGNECFGYQVILKKNGTVYFANNVTPTGATTPVSFTSLPPDNYEIVFNNGFCEVSQTFTILQGNPTCNLQVNVTNESKPNSGCSNGSITINMQGNANGNNYVLTITKDGSSVFNAGYSSISAVSDIVSNLSAGNYVITLSYSGSGACIASINYTLNSLPCNLVIADVVTTQACGNATNGAIAFDVNGAICETSALQLLNNTGSVLVNTTISQSEGRLFENLAAGNYSIQVTTPSGCSVNYPFTIDPICNINLFNETVSLEGAGSCTTAKLSYFVNANYCSASLVKLINNTDMTIFYQSNLPNQDGLDANEITNIPVGNYTLQVLNNSGNCSASYNFIVAPAPCSNIQFSNVTLGESTSGCAWAFGYDLNLGNCPGSIMTLAKEGNLVNTYFFNESVSTEINNLSAGNYNLHLTTGSGCIIDYPFEVSPVCNLAIANVITTQSCDASASGTISFNLSGNICLNTPLRLLDNTGLIINSQMINEAGNYSFIDLIAGNYSIQLVNQAGCSLNYPFTIEPQCDLSLFNESITLEGAGNCTTAKLSYFVNANYCSASLVKLINNTDMTIFYQSNLPNQDGIDANEITNIPVGNYTLQVLNSSGNCSASYNFIVAPAPCSNIQFSNVTLGESTSGCAWAFGYDLNLGNCPGSVLTLSKNGSLLNTYNLNESVSTEINNLSIGNYNLHLNTSSGCVIDYPFEVIPVCNMTIASLFTVPACDALNNGWAGFSVNGTICNNTQVQLFNDDNVSISSFIIDHSATYSFADLNNGNYTIQVTNDAGCSTSQTFSLNPFCELEITNENITLEGSGSCTTAKLTYHLTGTPCSATIIKLINNIDMSVVFQSNAPNLDGLDEFEIANLSVGNYTLLLTNNSGSCTDAYNFSITPQPCSNIQFTNVSINPSPTDGCYYNFGYDLNLGNCPGSILTLNQNSSVVETYNLIGSVSTEITNLTTGNYNLHLSSAGCEIDYPFEVTPSLCNINIANAVVSSTGVLYCVNGRIDFDVTGTTCGTGAVALIQNGNILNTINWTTGNGTGLHFENMSPGNYSIVAVNNLFNVTCGDTLNFTVNSVLPPLTISNVNVNSTGVLGCTNGNVSFVVNGQFCTNGYVIVFNESNTIVYSAPYNNGGNQIYNVTGLAPGNYTIEFGLVGYSVTETFTITPNPCNLAITNLQINTIAGSDNCTIANVTFTPTGDMCSNGFIQLMQNGFLIGTSTLWNQNTAPNISYDNLSPGIYTIFIATYLPNYCSTSLNFEVLPAPCSLNIASISSTPSNGSNGTIDVTGAGTYCGNIAIALDAEISAGNYSNLTTNYGNLATQFANLAPGNYRVTISSSGSTCTDVEFITVTGTICNTNPTISASATSICPGQTIVLNSNYLTGNTWSNGSTSFNTQVTTAGTYTLTVTELNGCTGNTSITINAGTNCVPATQMNNGVCGNMNFVKTSSITCLPVSGATQYEWQFSNGSGVYATKTTSTNYVLLHSVSPSLNWGTNWNIKVRAYIGANVGPFSNNCTIGIITDPTIGGVPLTQLRTQDCGKLNYRLNADNRIIANPIAGAIQYEFEFTSALNGLVVATKVQANNVLFLNTITPALSFPAQYNVRVRARIGSTWAVFGTPCLIGIIGLNREEENIDEETAINPIKINADIYFELMVMPNPFTEQATLNVHSNIDEMVNVEVYDLIGNKVWDQQVQTNSNIVFGLDLAQGSYIINAINQNGERALFRFIKSK
jgi:hypothetical protein